MERNTLDKVKYWFSASKLVLQLKVTFCLDVFIFNHIHNIATKSNNLFKCGFHNHGYSSNSSSSDWIPATSCVSVFSHEFYPVTWHISVHVILPLRQGQTWVPLAPWQLHLISSMIAVGAYVFLDGMGSHLRPVHCQSNIPFFTSGMEMIGLWACLQAKVWTKALNKCCLKAFGVGGM